MAANSRRMSIESLEFYDGAEVLGRVRIGETVQYLA